MQSLKEGPSSPSAGDGWSQDEFHLRHSGVGRGNLGMAAASPVKDPADPVGSIPVSGAFSRDGGSGLGSWETFRLMEAAAIEAIIDDGTAGTVLLPALPSARMDSIKANAIARLRVPERRGRSCSNEAGCSPTARYGLGARAKSDPETGSRSAPEKIARHRKE